MRHALERKGSLTWHLVSSIGLGRNGLIDNAIRHEENLLRIHVTRSVCTDSFGQTLEDTGRIEKQTLDECAILKPFRSHRAAHQATLVSSIGTSVCTRANGVYFVSRAVIACAIRTGMVVKS